MGTIKTPAWLVVLTALILAALVYAGMARPYILLARGEPVEIDGNQYMGEKRPPGRFYATLWDELDLAEGFICLSLGLLCFALGIIRAFNRLGSRQIFLLALFSALFSLMSFSLTDFAARSFAPEVLFYLFWFSFFLYPAALILHLFFCSPLKTWLWPLAVLPAAYGAAAFLMYFAFGLPLDVPERLYTYLALACFAAHLIAGLFQAESRETAWYTRGIAAYWVVWLVYLGIRARAGAVAAFHNEFKTAVMVSAALMMCYMLFVNTRELAGYRSGLRRMELKNDFLQRNYQTLEGYLTRIARMKHETRHHLFAIRTLAKSGEYERLDEYLSDIQAEYAEMEAPAAGGSRVIQAVLSHAADRAREMGFALELDILPVPALSVPDADLVSLFMNVLDNALESCARIGDPGARWITVRLKARPPYLCLSVRNAPGAPEAEKDPILHGHGMKIIRKIAAKHGGLVSFSQTKDAFGAEIALPVLQE
ncbi:MAG: GHKL domain-containing protein [Oscillospiraceae bacterium]|nr:GHKL domain-containing protein [Oscillospiraceae bacterium]